MWKEFLVVGKETNKDHTQGSGASASALAEMSSSMERHRSKLKLSCSNRLGHVLTAIVVVEDHKLDQGGEM